MNKFEIMFSKFMNTVLKIVLPLVIVASIGIFFATLLSFNLGTIVFTIAIVVSLFLSYKIINSTFDNKKKVYLLFIIGTIIRVLWLLNAKNTPGSDFEMIYDCAGKLINNDTSSFKGTAYIARFPHLTMTVLYMALIQYLCPSYNLVVMQIISLFLGLVSLGIIYKIVEELFYDKKKAIISLAIGNVFPPLVTYISVFCSENLAMPFYLLSIYFFLKCSKSGQYKCLILLLSGILLSVGNLMRMIGSVVLIAYIMYIVIYFKDNILKKVLNICCVTLPYILILVLVSSTLQKMNITENALWRGREPKITNVLKGTNISSLGMWNAEDANMVADNLEDFDKLEEMCKDVIYSRLTNTSPIKLGIFYVVKLCAQWCVGDFAGSFWTQYNKQDKILFKIGGVGSAPLQLVYIFMLILAFLGVKSKRNISINPNLNLFYLIFIGYISTYLITENQFRYGYIVCWLFIIFAIDGLQNLDLKALRNNKIKIFKNSKELDM